MAITNAQQYKQLVNPSMDGKRPGYRGPGEYQGGRSSSSKSSSSKSSSKSSNTNTGGGGRDLDYQQRGTDKATYDLRSELMQEQGTQQIYRGDDRKKDPFVPTTPKESPSFLENLVTNRRKQLYNFTPNNPKNELKYIQDLKFRNPAAYDLLPDNLKALYEETEDAANEFNAYKDFDKFSFEDFEDLRKFDPGNTGAMNFADYAATYAGAPGLKYSGNVGNLEKYVTGKDEFGRTMYGYRERPDNDRGGDGIMSDYERRLLELEQQLKNQQAAAAAPTTGGPIAYRFFADGGSTGGIMDTDIVGGMMDGNMDEMGRQMYGLGKLVKKATRGIKKLVKSPIGKAALLYAGGSFLSGKGLFGGLKGAGFLKSEGLKNFFLKDATKKFALDNLTQKGLMTGIAGLSALPFIFQGDDEEEFDPYRGPDIDIANIRSDPYAAMGGAYRFAADGGIMRAGYQEGGDAEPVAKKTMPLIDMDGKEKDYRETGGFVDMGRMERADDVPARLSKNEFVFTADAVRNAGDGDIDKGAEVMYNMMKNLEAGGEVSEESQGLEGARNMFQTSQRLGEVI